MAVDLNDNFSINIKDVKPVGDISRPNFLLRAAAQFPKRGIPLIGFNAVLINDVPMGTGLLSSTAIECATTFALNELPQIDSVQKSAKNS